MKLLSVIIRVSLILMIAATPWLFAGVWTLTQWALLLIVCVLLAADLFSRFGRYDPSAWVPTLWLPLYLGIGLGIAQLVPLGPATANLFAPAMSELRADLTAPALDATGAESDEYVVNRQTRSLFPAATREYLALFILATAVFVLSSTHMVDRNSVLSFFAALAVCGAALSFFGLIQRLSWNGKFYWVFETAQFNLAAFGPFANRNNAGGFLNLCLGAGLGLLVALHWNRYSGSMSVRDARKEKSSRNRDIDRFTRKKEEPSRAADKSENTHLVTDPESDSESSNKDRASHYAALLGSQNASTEPNDEPNAPPDSEPSRARQRQKVRVREKRRVRIDSDEQRDVLFSDESRKSSYRVYSKNELLVVRLSSFLTESFGTVNARKLWSITLVVFCLAGVLCTASRGAVVALAVGLLVTVAAVMAHTGKRGFALGILGLLVVSAGLMSWAGQTDFVQNRLSQLFADEALETGRIPNWQEALKTVPDHWTFGTGLGSYRYVYERYQHRFLDEVAHFHAENQFIQALVEGGVVALILLFLAILLTGYAIWRLFRSGGLIDVSLAVAGTFVLASQLVGGMFDFGLYIPANAILMSSICGIIAGRAAWISVVGKLDVYEEASAKGIASLAQFDTASLPLGSRNPSTNDELGTPRSANRRANRAEDFLLRLAVPAIVAPVAIGLLMLGALFASLEMHKASIVETAIRTSPLIDVRESSDLDLIKSGILSVRLAVAQRWDDANGHRHLSELQQHMYHAQTYLSLLSQINPEDTLRDDREGSEEDDLSNEETGRDESIWERSSVLHLFKAIRSAQINTDNSLIEQLRQQPTVTEWLTPAWRHMKLARWHCPTMPYAHYAMAEMSVINEEEPSDEIHLSRAKRLSPADANLLFWSGVLAIHSNRIEDGLRDWQESLMLMPTNEHLDNILLHSTGKLTVRQLLNHIIPRHTGLLYHTAATHFASENPRIKKIQFAILRKAKEAIQETSLPEDELHFVAAKTNIGLGDMKSAADHYKKAINANRKKYQWKYEVAKILFDLGQFTEAREFAENAHNQNPTQAYHKLLYQINKAIVENN